jgi:hypothetical protein
MVRALLGVDDQMLGDCDSDERHRAETRRTASSAIPAR